MKTTLTLQEIKEKFGIPSDSEIVIEGVKQEESTERYITITDSGEKKTSELLVDLPFPVWSFYSDKELDAQFPPPKKSTTRKFIYSQEPDIAWRGKSVRKAESIGAKCITLRERLIYELLYFKETGKHLDIIGITFCGGSRDKDGGVPSCYWNPNGGRFEVGWCTLAHSRSDYGVRVAV